ncbi:MAG: glycoside hydrolase family 78 protein [Chitinophagaceae bacterium]
MRKSIFTVAVMLVAGICSAQLKVQDLLTENLLDPISIDMPTPALSWKIVEHDKQYVMQTAYEIKVSLRAPSARSKKEVWTSGKVSSDQSLYVPYDGEPLSAGQRYHWQVRVWDNYGNTSEWSEPAWWQMGMLNASDWSAKWITPGYKEDSLLQPSPLFRKNFKLVKKIKYAVAYITAHGLYEASINGKRIGDSFLTPGWTSYNKRLQYQAYDVTSLLQNGDNAVGAMLGSGWYRGYLAWGSNHNVYGKDIALLFQLQLTYEDGSAEKIVSDETWKSSTGNIRNSEIYFGETIDGRKDQPGWATPTFDDRNWSGITVQDFPKNTLIATYNEPVRQHETFKPLRIFKTPKGDRIIDFGQNLVGWVKINVSGHAGDTIVISHAEVMDKSDEFYTENLRNATSKDLYVLSGTGVETFEPHFTWHGFRFVKIEGNTGEIKAEDFTAIALYSAMRPTGIFTCSNPLLNQLQHNIQWGQKGNFLDVPTDCPQRDERLGWTGDAQVFSRTASFNMNVHNFFTKWLKDVAADQYTNGAVPHVIPDVLTKKNQDQGGSAGWSDVATIMPWDMYLAYGDKRILENQYNSMKAWVGYMTQKSKNNLWNSGSHFGDWLFYSLDNDNDGKSAITSKYLIAQCFYAHSTQLVINAAKVLGKQEDIIFYNNLLAKVKEAYLKEYVSPNGLISGETQTAYVLALQFDLLPDNLRQQAAARLVKSIEQYRNHLTTGFLGTPYLCHVLNRFGYQDVAYKLLLQETYPSWLYPVKMGATTIWERWNGIRTDGTFASASMNSFNHYAYGAIGDWMYRVVTGIDTRSEAPGYKQIIIKPTIGGDLKYAGADYETGYGKISSHWALQNGALQLDVIIPANTTATVYMPVTTNSKVRQDAKELNNKMDNGYMQIDLGSGSYHFSSSGF